MLCRLIGRVLCRLIGRLAVCCRRLCVGVSSEEVRSAIGCCSGQAGCCKVLFNRNPTPTQPPAAARSTGRSSLLHDDRWLWWPPLQLIVDGVELARMISELN